MDKAKFEKIKKIVIIVIVLIFIADKSYIYFAEKKEETEIKFYALTPQTSIDKGISINENSSIKQENSSVADEKNEQTNDMYTENENNDSSDNTISQGSSYSGGKLNINKASQSELETLYRIGPSLAKKIIEYRESSGDFVSIEELKEVKGIGEAIFVKIKDDICVD